MEASMATGPATNAPANSEGILIGDKVYSEVFLTIDNSLIPEEKLSSTPSMQDGLDLETETDLRILGCELIQSAGILLRLPQVNIATVQIYYDHKINLLNCRHITLTGWLNQLLLWCKLMSDNKLSYHNPTKSIIWVNIFLYAKQMSVLGMKYEITATFRWVLRSSWSATDSLDKNKMAAVDF